MTKSKMVCITGKTPLHKLNESVGGGRYILEGVFAELDKLNRNSRIYTKEEYLKHLQYLRDDIRKGEPLLGELDHPEDRFEVKLKEVSHRILDIWYDQSKNVVMGKIELLNTPNGKLAQSIVDQGIPLHISSRAAGSVNSDNTVSIQQIYTFDLVCKPGFAGAVLHRVNESADSNYYSNDVMGFLKKTQNIESINEAANYGFVKNNIMISDVDAEVKIRKEALDIIKENDNIRNIMKKNYKSINEGDDFADLFAPTEDDEKEAKSKGKDKEDNEDEEGDDDEKKDKKDGVEILSITPVYTSDENNKDESEEDEEDKSEEDEESEDEDSEKDSKKKSTDECNKRGTKKANPETDKLYDQKNQSEDNQVVINKLDQIVARIEKNAGKNGSQKQEECDGAKCESLIMAQYPISRSLNESNFAQFAALNEEQKSKVTAYLQDRGIYAPKMINEMWKNGINYKASEPVWLKYAPAKYKSLYNEAPQRVRESLANTAEYLIFESQRDVNIFWENSGLETKAESAKRNKAFTDNLPKINESASAKSNGLPYSVNLINTIVEMANIYN